MNVPTFNRDAEEAVLGAILCAGNLDRGFAHRIMDEVLTTGLLPEQFYVESFGRLFEVLVQMRLRALPLDTISVADELDQGHADSHLWGRLEQLAYIVIGATSAAHHARIVARCHRERAVDRPAGHDVGTTTTTEAPPCAGEEAA